MEKMAVNQVLTATILRCKYNDNRFPYRDWANEFPEVQVSAAGITGVLKKEAIHTEACHVAVGFAIILLV
jgi:hypothetical protein